MLGKDIQAGDWLVIIKNGEKSLRLIRAVAHRGAGVDLDIGFSTKSPMSRERRPLPWVVGRDEEVAVVRAP